MYKKKKWDEFINRPNPSEVAEVDEGIFWYFLEVLPPVYMNRLVALPGGRVVKANFGFAEGAELITAFWREGERFFCCRTDDYNRG